MGKSASRIILAGVFAALCCICSLAAQAAEKTAELACVGYKGETTLENFQALVKLSAANGYGFDYADCAAQDGSDLWFTDSSGNVIAHEIDSWTQGGDSFIWVKIPQVAGTADASYPTKITMHWGGDGKETTNESVWSGFAGVWHMNGEVVDDAPQNETDATGHGLDAVPTAVYAEEGKSCVLSEMARTPGVVGNARVNQSNATTYSQGLAVGDYSDHITDASKFTFSGWFSATSLGVKNHYPRLVSAEGATAFWSIVGSYSSGFGKIAGVYSGGNSAVGALNVGNFESSKWVYLTVVWNGTTVQVYANGEQKIEATDKTAQTTLDTGFMIGGNKSATDSKRAWHGSYDEIRMYDGAMSEERAVADYATMSAPTEFLVYVSSVDSALWTGAADDGDGTNALNWECRDAKGDVMSGTLPTESTKILSCTLGANADWSQLGFAPFIPASSVVELNGYTLTVSGIAGPGKVNNAAQGEAAQLVVSGSADWTNSDTVFDGNLKFVKTGAGTFTSTIAQSYTGGTVVGAGTIQAPRSTAAYDATFTPFGTGTITIGRNGVLNVQSTVAYRNGVVLDGGTITGGVQQGSSQNEWGAGRPVVMLERLTADSTITHSAKGLDIGAPGTPVDLGGYTLSVAIADATYFRFFGSLADTAGKIVTTGAGFLQELPALARGVDIDCSSDANLTLSGTEVHDYRAANGDRKSAAGTGRGVKVNGTYTPVGNYYYGCMMENGSTIDLSGRTGCFNVKSSLTEYNGNALDAAEKLARKTVQFEAGTVTVNLAGRADLDDIAESEDPYIVKWSTDEGMGEPSETTFVPDAATAQAYKFRKDSTGLTLAKNKGFMLIVK